MAFTLRIETSWTYISIRAATSALSLRWWRWKALVRNRPLRSCGTRNNSLPTRVTSLRLLVTRTVA